MNLVIIDSGLNDKINLSKITEQISIRVIDGKKEITENFKNNPYHCDTIFNIISERSGEFKSNKDINIYVINILDENLKTSFELLYDAFKIAIEKKADLINVSLGYIKYDKHKYFEKLVNKFLKKKCFIICSASEELTYPALLKNVVTVADMYLFENKKGRIKFEENIDYVADIRSFKFNFTVTSSTSFAVPFVTAKAIDILINKKIGNINELKFELSKYFRKWGH